MEKYMNSRGQEILLEGKLTTDEWEKDGQKRSKNALVVSSVHFCGKKDNGGDNSTHNAPEATPVETDELPF